jgi:hypothetical protein
VIDAGHCRSRIVEVRAMRNLMLPAMALHLTS